MKFFMLLPRQYAQMFGIHTESYSALFLAVVNIVAISEGDISEEVDRNPMRILHRAV
jgi:hypothetical protein